MSDPVILRSIKKLGEDNLAFDLDGKCKMYILQSPDFIKHVKEVVGGLLAPLRLKEYKANSLWNKYSYVVPGALLWTYKCAICRMFLKKLFITIPLCGWSLLSLHIQGVDLSF